MPCNVVLYDLLGAPKQPGGSWTLHSGGPVSLSVNGGAPTSYSNTNSIPGNHNMSIGFDGAAAGNYVFRYTVGVVPCVDTADVTVTVQPSAKAGADRTLLFCNSDTNTYNLYEFLRNFNGLGGLTPGQTEVTVENTGTWSGNGTTSPAYTANSPTSPTDDTFRPNLVTFPSGSTQVTLTFVYTVNKVPGSTCTNCADTATITINVTLQPNAGADAAITVCNAL